MKQMKVDYEPQYLTYVYTAEELDEPVKSLIKQLRPLWKKGMAFGCLCPENITLYQKDHRLCAEADLKTMFVNEEYSAPEKEKTPASDIFSLGLLMHEMHAEYLPFIWGDSDTVAEALRKGEKVEVDDLLDDLHYNLISRMIEADPEKRITPDELLASLEVGRTQLKYRRDHDGTAWVNVSVHDEDGNPVENAHIMVTHVREKEEFFDAVTDEEGKAEVEISSGESWLTVYAYGYEMIDRKFFIYAEDTLHFDEVVHVPTETDEKSFIYQDDSDDIPF